MYIVFEYSEYVVHTYGDKYTDLVSDANPVIDGVSIAA